MLCMRCREVRDDTGAPTCARCGGDLVPPTQANLDLLVEQVVQARLKSMVGRWRSEGLVDTRTARRLQERLGHDAPPPPPEPKPSAPPAERRPSARQRREAAIAARNHPPPLVASAPPPPPMPAIAAVAVAMPLETPGFTTDAHAADASDAAHRAETLFQAPSEAVSTAAQGLDAFAAFDAPELSRRKDKVDVGPILYENVGWFVGALLVLAGSVYGVREAWRTLGDVARHVIVAGAFLAYHAGFAGLSALLAKKAPSAGKVLGVISAGLLAVVFAATASLVAVRAGPGLGLAVACAAVSWVTLRSVAKRLEIEPVSLLPMAFLVPVVAEVGVGLGTSGGILRGLLPFAGLGALAWATRTETLKNGANSLWMLTFGGAVALEVFAAVGMPGEPDAATLAPGTIGFALATLRGLVFGGVVASLGRKPALRQAFPTWAGLLELGALGAAGLAAIASGRAVLGAAAAPMVSVALVHASVALACGFVFTRAARMHGAALHFVVPSFALAATIVGAAVVPDRPAFWALGAALAAAGGLAAARTDSLFSKAIPNGWSVVVATVAPVAAWRLDPATPSWALAATAGISAAGFFASGTSERLWHRYLGSAAAAWGVAAIVLPNATDDAFVTFLAASGIAAGLASVLFERTERDTLRPFDDVSLGLLLWSAVRATMLPTDDRLGGALVAGAGALLLVRSVRDTSRLVSGIGALTVLLGAERIVQPAFGLPAPVLPGAAALLAMFVASLRGPGTEKTNGRAFFGAVPLPWAERPRALLFDAFALAATAELVRVIVSVGTWFAGRDETLRMPTVASAALAAAALLVAFATPAARAVSGRGHVAFLWALAGFAAAAGITNRVGRPLPPDVVGAHLTEYAIGLWLMAIAIQRFGPAIAEFLEAPEQGRRYHFVPHTGVFALFAVLTIDAWFVAATSFLRALQVMPPTLVLGPALIAALLARSSRKAAFLHVTFGFGLVGAALVAAQRSVYGPHLVPLDPPGGRWVPAGTEAIAFDGNWLDPASWLTPETTVFDLQHVGLNGVATAGVLLAAFALVAIRSPQPIAEKLGILVLRSPDAHEDLRGVAAGWAVAGSVVVLLASFTLPGLLAAGLCLATGLVLAAARARHSGLMTAGLSIATLLHALATASPRIPEWTGAACALVAFAVVAALPFAKRARPASSVFGGHFLAAFLLAEGLVYAFAARGLPDPTNAGPQVLGQALLALSGPWMSSWALAATLVLTALTSALAAVNARRVGLEEHAPIAAFFSGISGGCALLVALVRYVDATDAGFSVHVLDTGGSAWFWRSLGPLFGLVAAGSAVALHAANRFLHAREEDESLGGWRVSRDVWLVLTAVFVALFLARNGNPAAPPTGSLHVAMAIAALVLGAFACAHVAWRESTPRHVYMLQSAAVGVYGVIRAEYARTLPPEADALFALALGFVLVGVTVVARRRNIPPVAQATRRFAALLPIAIGLILPFDANPTAALFAAGSGALWGALGWVERSRLFGSLGAAAVNLALLVFALSSGLNGAEIYLAPLGLFLMALGQIFGKTLDSGTKQLVRVGGSLLLYLPAAYQIAFQVGNATDGTYPVLFGIGCLVGIGAGMLLHIRAYLALGTMFLTLDVAASLVRAGLRDNRVGFALLSLTGCFILGLMVFINLRRDLVRRAREKLVAGLAGWE